MVDYLNEKFEQKLTLIKGLASVEGNVVFGGTGYNQDYVNMYATYYGGEEPEGRVFQLTKDHIELLNNVNTIDEVIEVYNDIGYFKEQ